MYMKKQLSRYRVKVTDEIVAELKEEFKVSNTTIILALRFVNNSDKARQIRAAAVEKMKRVAKQNDRLLKEDLQDAD